MSEYIEATMESLTATEFETVTPERIETQKQLGYTALEGLTLAVPVESHPLANIEQHLKHSIIGQDDAIDSIMSALNREKFRNPNRPYANLLFLGPTGVGKSETVKELAKQLHEDGSGFLKIDCSLYSHGHEVSALLGSPPGFVGREQPASLDPNIIEQEKSVILFDEIEKGSQPLWDLLLHIMDDGEISLLDRAEKVSFKNSIIIMTSNLGSHEMMGLLQPQKLGFRTTQTDEAPVSNQEINTVVNKALYLRFSPEFINRFDRKVVFKPLDDGQLSQVLDRYVEKANYDRYLGHGVKLSLSPTLRDEMVTGNTQRRQLGVRPILRDYDHMIESKLATLMNTESIPLGSDVVAMSSTELQHVEEARKGDVNFYYKNNPELVEYLEKLALEREQKAARLANEQEIFQAAEESEETLPPNND
jgi:ATP-dependent Clp protease ATP-binding subunit ClpA